MGLQKKFVVDDFRVKIKRPNSACFANRGAKSARLATKESKKSNGRKYRVTVIIRYN